MVLPQHIGRAGIVAVAALLFLAIGPSPAAAQSASCHSLDLQVGIGNPNDATCSAGNISEDDFRGRWEAVEIETDGMLVLAVLQQSGARSGFYRQSLETTIKSLFYEDDELEWSTGIDDDRFDVRRFYYVDRSDRLPCVGFQATSGTLMGTDSKSVLYGYICSIEGEEFFDEEVVDMLSRIRA